jgi:sporulation protein YlmC with PRC-barrel domain
MSSHYRWALVLLLAGGLVFPGLAMADNSPQNPSQMMQKMQNQSSRISYQPNLEWTRDMVGKNVMDTQGNQLGRVESVLIDATAGSMTYAVVGPAEGQSNQASYVVPISAFMITPQAGAQQAMRPGRSSSMAPVTLDIDMGTLETAPTFQQDDLQRLRNADTRRAIHHFYDTNSKQYHSLINEYIGAQDQARAYEVSGATTPDYIRLSSMTGWAVRDTQNRELGTMENVVIDMDSGRPVYAIVTNGLQRPRNMELAPVPWSEVTVEPRSQMLRAHATSEELGAFAFATDQRPDLTNPQFAQRIYQQYNTTPYWQVYGYVSPGTQQRNASSQMSGQHKEQSKSNW